MEIQTYIANRAIRIGLSYEEAKELQDQLSTLGLLGKGLPDNLDDIQYRLCLFFKEVELSEANEEDLEKEYKKRLKR